jgi:hydrogenase nickel incorporation protein HypB
MMAIKVITVKEDIFGANEEKAKQNQERLDQQGILAVNIMASPGGGKTSLILKTIEGLRDKLRLAVVEGDVASSMDAERVHEQGIPVVQVNTEGGCHLDARMMEQALDNLPLEDIDLLFIENVGNLICPAEFVLGEHRRAVIASIPEGDDKPHKYPLMFTEADVVLLNKADLIPYLDFKLDDFEKAVTGLKTDCRIMQLSCKTGEGLDAWFTWLLEQTGKK